jgi:long-chain fatty acid transport protein
MLQKLTTTFLIVFAGASFVLASGFSIYEQGAKATALGGAFVAQANDISAVFYNPAGITSLKGFNVGLGVTIIQPQAQFTGPTKKDPKLFNTAKKETFTPPTFYTTYQISENVTAGFGFFVPFGLGSDWGKNWVGRYLATKSEVQTFYLNPTIAYKVLDNLSLAVGFNYVFGNVTLEKAVDYSVRNIDVYSKLEASTTGMGYNLGLQFKPLSNLTLGAAYRSNVLLDFKDGDATFEFPEGAADKYTELNSFFPNTKGSAELELPFFASVGLAYDFSDRLTAEFDYFLIGWESYDILTVKFDDPVAGHEESVSERMYENSASYRLGLEYRVNSDLALRAGYILENKAVPDERVEPSLPEGNRNIYNLGFGYKLSSITIDGFYMLLMQDDRTITNSVDEFNGTYESMAHLFGLSFGYSF